MPEKISELKPANKVLRWLVRSPISLYNIGLGWLFGNHMLMLTHVGRMTGLPRRVVLEVVKYDRERERFYIVSSWMEKADWYKNIRKTPLVEVHFKNRHFSAFASRMEPEEAELIILDYGRRNPRMLRFFARVTGYRLEDNEDDYRAFGRIIPVIEIRPHEIDPRKETSPG